MANNAVASAKVPRQGNGLHAPIAFVGSAVLDHEKNREGLMKKVLDGAEQKYHISLSTMGVIVSIAIGLWTIGGTIVSTIRGDTKQEMEIQQLREVMGEIKTNQTKAEERQILLERKVDEVLTDKKIQDAKVQGYKLGQTDGEKDHK